MCGIVDVVAIQRAEFVPHAPVRGLAVQEDEKDVGLPDLFARAHDAELFDGVLCVGDAGRIDEAKRLVIQGDLGLDGIGRRAGNIGDNGPFVPEKMVKEARFSDIWGTREHDAQSVRAVLVVGAFHALDLVQNRTGFAPHEVGRKRGEVFLGRKVDRRLDMAEKVEHCRPQRLDRMGDRPRKLALCFATLMDVLRMDDVHDRFGFRQVDLAVQKRPRRKLPGLRRCRAGLTHELKHASEVHASPMRINFNRIFARVRMRCFEITDEHVVNGFAVGRVENPVVHHARRQFLPVYATSNDSERVVAAEADDSNGCRSGPRCDGCYRIHGINLFFM